MSCFNLLMHAGAPRVPGYGRNRPDEASAVRSHPELTTSRFFQDAHLDELSTTLRRMLLDTEREATKRYLRQFIAKIVITLPKVEIFGKTEALLAALQNKKAARTDGVLTAVGAWLPGTYEHKNWHSSLVLEQNPGIMGVVL